MTLVWTPGWNGLTEPEAVSYVAAVEAADGQPLEFATAKAINDFVLGCKNDGIWSAIKASCILAGARTLAGALVPLVGAAPDNYNFVDANYDRKTGLVGDGSTKYLNLNRAENADPLNNCHYSLYASTLGALERGYMAPADNSATLIYRQANYLMRSRTGTPFASGIIAAGFMGHSRPSATTFTARCAGSNNVVSANSVVAGSSNMLLYNRAMGNYTDARLAFYSIGESLDLALLDNRVSTLIAQFGAVIP